MRGKMIVEIIMDIRTKQLLAKGTFLQVIVNRSKVNDSSFIATSTPTAENLAHKGTFGQLLTFSPALEISKMFLAEAVVTLLTPETKVFVAIITKSFERNIK